MDNPINQKTVFNLLYGVLDDDPDPKNTTSISYSEWRSVYDIFGRIIYDSVDKQQANFEALWLIGLDLTELHEKWEDMIGLANDGLTSPRINHNIMLLSRSIYAKSFALLAMGKSREGVEIFTDQGKKMNKNDRDYLVKTYGFGLLRISYRFAEGQYPRLNPHLSDEEISTGSGAPLPEPQARIAKEILSLLAEKYDFASLTWEGLARFFESLWRRKYSIEELNRAP